MNSLLLWVFMWIGGKLFPYIDVYSPDKEDVTAVTFTREYQYIQKSAFLGGHDIYRRRR